MPTTYTPLMPKVARNAQNTQNARTMWDTSALVNSAALHRTWVGGGPSYDKASMSAHKPRNIL